MKKKTYKAMQRRYLRVLKQKEELRLDNEILAEEKEEAEERYNRLKKRFMEFGRNVITEYPGSGNIVTEKWEMHAESLGNGLMFSTRKDDLTQEDFLALIDQYKAELIMGIVNVLMEDQLVQFYTKEEAYPLFGGTILGAKIYVVPWEQVPHRRTVELRRYVENTLTEDEGL